VREFSLEVREFVQATIFVLECGFGMGSAAIPGSPNSSGLSNSSSLSIKFPDRNSL
jgi:hypothetical protein